MSYESRQHDILLDDLYLVFFGNLQSVDEAFDRGALFMFVKKESVLSLQKNTIYKSQINFQFYMMVIMISQT